ncbi:hypothetical protein Tco_0024209 [Tanacetum coccineum]
MEMFFQPTNDPLALVSNASVQQYPTQSSKSPQPSNEPSPADKHQLDSGSSSTENLIENYPTHLPSSLNRTNHIFLKQTINLERYLMHRTKLRFKTAELLFKMSVKDTMRTIKEKSKHDLESLFPKIVSRLAILGVVITQEDLNSKFLTSLPPEWNTHVVVWMNKAEIETMSIDDLYNNFKIVEQSVKKSVGASSGAQNLAFMTAPSTSSTVTPPKYDTQRNTTIGVLLHNTCTRVPGGPNGFKPRTGLSNPIDLFNALAFTNTW